VAHSGGAVGHAPLTRVPPKILQSVACINNTGKNFKYVNNPNRPRLSSFTLITTPENAEIDGNRKNSRFPELTRNFKFQPDNLTG